MYQNTNVVSNTHDATSIERKRVEADGKVGVNTCYYTSIKCTALKIQEVNNTNARCIEY